MSGENGFSVQSPQSAGGAAVVDHNLSTSAVDAAVATAPVPNWVANAGVLWDRRCALLRVGAVSLLAALAIAFLLPKQYESSARLMPPGNSMGGAAVLAALAGRSGGSLSTLGALAGGFLGGGGNTSLFIDLLRSGTVSGRLMDRFGLQHVYHKRYRVDAAKYLARRTAIVDDKRSGVITLTVTDNDPVRARDIAQGYLDELNQLVSKTNTSSARQERIFIEKRLQGAKADLESAQQRLSEFSSTHSTIDMKEETRALVDAASRVESQLIVEQAGLDSLRQTYGDQNIRVRSAQARIGMLRGKIAKMAGSSKALPASPEGGTATPDAGTRDGEIYPALRQLPRLAVPYADLYREVQVREQVFELLTQQYEVARIQEAKDVPVVSVIDAPGVPEKKSFPPRLLLAVLLSAACVGAVALRFLVEMRWGLIPENDPRKLLAQRVARSARHRLRAMRRRTSARDGATR